jgi:hypothetical protein
MNVESGELLVQYLRDCAIGGAIATYSDISEIVGYDIRKRRGALYTAINKVLEDYNYSFRCVAGVGYKPMQGIEQCQVTGRKARQSIQNTTRKWRGHYAAVKAADLSQEELKTYIFEGLRLNHVEEAIGAKADAKIEEAIDSAQSLNPLSKENMRQIMRNCMRQLEGVG